MLTQKQKLHGEIKWGGGKHTNFTFLKMGDDDETTTITTTNGRKVHFHCEISSIQKIFTCSVEHNAHTHTHFQTSTHSPSMKVGYNSI